MILQVCPANGENKIENQALTKIQSDEEEIVDFSAQFVKSQEILKSEDDDHSGVVQKARKIKFSPLKNPTSISLVAKDEGVTMENLSDDYISEENSMENKIENPALNEQTESVSKKIQEVQLFLEK